MSDITKHEFSDTIAEIYCSNASEDKITIKNPLSAPWLYFDVDDVKAMAEYFGLITGDDNEC